MMVGIGRADRKVGKTQKVWEGTGSVSPVIDCLLTCPFLFPLFESSLPSILLQEGILVTLLGRWDSEDKRMLGWQGGVCSQAIPSAGVRTSVLMEGLSLIHTVCFLLWDGCVTLA